MEDMYVCVCGAYNHIFLYCTLELVIVPVVTASAKAFPYMIACVLGTPKECAIIERSLSSILLWGLLRSIRVCFYKGVLSMC